MRSASRRRGTLRLYLNFFGSSQVDYATSCRSPGTGSPSIPAETSGSPREDSLPTTASIPTTAASSGLIPGRRNSACTTSPGTQPGVGARVRHPGASGTPRERTTWRTTSRTGSRLSSGAVSREDLSFDPSRVPFSDGLSIDYSRTSLSRVCAVGSRDASCYHEYPIPILHARCGRQCGVLPGGWLPTGRRASSSHAPTVWSGMRTTRSLLRTLLWGSWYGHALAGEQRDRPGPADLHRDGGARDRPVPLATPSPAVGQGPSPRRRTATSPSASSWTTRSRSFGEQRFSDQAPARTRLRAEQQDPCMSEAFVPDFSYMDSDGTMHLATERPDRQPRAGRRRLRSRLRWRRKPVVHPDRARPAGSAPVGSATSPPTARRWCGFPPLGVFPGKAAYSGLA